MSRKWSKTAKTAPKSTNTRGAYGNPIILSWKMATRSQQCKFDDTLLQTTMGKNGQLETFRALDLPAGGIFGRWHPLLCSIFRQRRVNIVSKCVKMGPNESQMAQKGSKVAQNSFKMSQSGVRKGQKGQNGPK